MVQAGRLGPGVRDTEGGGERGQVVPERLPPTVERGANLDIQQLIAQRIDDPRHRITPVVTDALPAQVGVNLLQGLIKMRCFDERLVDGCRFMGSRLERVEQVGFDALDERTYPLADLVVEG